MSTIEVTMLQRRLDTANLPLVAPDGQLIIEKSGSERKLHVGTGDGLLPITYGIQDLLDVLIDSPTARQALIYSSVDGKWENSSIQISDVSTLASSLSDLSSAIAVEGVARASEDDALQAEIDLINGVIPSKEDSGNKDPDSTFAANSDTKYPSQKAVKTALATKQDSLGFTPENAANREQANGYAGLDSGGLILASRLPNPSSSTKGGIKSKASASHQFLTQIGTDGSVSAAQPDFSDLSSNLSGPQDFTFSTAGEGYFFGGYGFCGCNVANGGGATITPNGVNRVNVFMFPLVRRITVRKVVIQVVAGVDGSVAAFGIYDTAGNKLIDSGSFSTGTANNNTTLSNTLGTPVTLDPGMYFYAFAGSSTATFVFLTNGTGSGQISGLINKNANRIRCRGTNTMSSGVLPSTLGTLINDATVNIAACMFES